MQLPVWCNVRKDILLSRVLRKNIGMWAQAAVLLIAACARGQEGEKEKVLPKPFGLGIGPAFVGGRDTDMEGTEVSLRIYGQYINYRVLLPPSAPGKATLQDAEDYNRYYASNECIGSCPSKSHCQNGICTCNNYESYVQIFGQCFSNSSASFIGDTRKYRKPTPPPIPEWCYKQDKNGHKKIDPSVKHRDECQEITYPNNFDDKTQFCSRGDHSFCLGKDINMFCSEKMVFDPREDQNRERHVCDCRKDMKFDRRNMECRLFIDVDCTYERAEGYTNKLNITERLNGVPISEEASLTEAEVRQAFCLLLESEAAEYNEHIVGEFVWMIWGLGAGSFFAICCGAICAACCCCKCCESVKAKIRAMDPRTHIKNMSPEAQMAALGAVAANEYIERKDDRNDAARIQAMQGGMPAAPGYGGGFPMPAGPGQGGFTPVPTGYGPAQQGYGQQPVYPPMGQQGYVPPAAQGLMGDAAHFAPELALGGVGAYTGNKTMMGLGLLAGAEKMDGAEDREDRLRAAAMYPPPPPMGYAGGQQLPTGQPPHMPPPTANYPRQQMQ